MYMTPNARSDFLQPPDARNSRLLNPFVLRSFVGITSLAQGASEMIGYLIENPSILSQIIFSIESENLFNHVAFSVIPSLFNYFSCQEMVKFALNFYIHASETPNFQRMMKLLVPFLNSGITAPFINSTMHKFFALFTPDLQIIDGSAYNLILSEYAATFIRYCTESLFLMPNEVIQLLKILLEKGCDIECMHELFFENFIFLQARAWSHKLIIKEKCKFFDAILNFVKSCSVELKFFMERIASIEYGSFFIPKFNSGFDKEPFEHFVCVNDICILAALLNRNKLFPIGLTINDFKDFNPKKKLCWFWVDVYIKSFNKKVRESSLFDGTGIGEIFDALIESRLENSQLMSWNEALVKHAVTIMDVTMNNIILSIPSKEFTTIQNIYFKNEAIFTSVELKKLYFLSSIKVFIARIPQKILRDLCELSRLFTPYMARARVILKLPKFDELVCHFRPSSQDAMIETMKRFKILDFVPLSVQFGIIVTCLKTIDQVAEMERTGDSLYCLMLDRMGSDVFLASFLLLSAFAVSSPVFSGLLTKKIISIWSKCDNSILTCLSFDQMYMEKVILMTKKLIAIGSPSQQIKKALSSPLLSMGRV